MASGVTVAYNDIVIHQMAGNGSFKMNTSGAYMEGDVDVVVDVEGGGGTLISKTITDNGTYNASDDNADGYSQVTVSVPSSGGDGTIGVNVVIGGEVGSFFNSVISNVRGYAFYSCSQLTAIDMPSCEIVLHSAFASCVNLSQINMPNLKSISNYAFIGCSALQKISFPQLVSIGANSTFYNCRSLSQAFFLGSFFSFGAGAFTNTPMSNSTYLGYFGSIYVPASLYNTYISASRWSAYSARIVGLTDEEIASL